MNKHIILFLAANPLGTTEVALGREVRAIQEELERSGQRDRFEFVTRWAVQPLDLIRELRKLKPTVVHFSGQGGGDRGQKGAGLHRDTVIGFGGQGGADDTVRQGGLFLQGNDGKPQFVAAAALQETFGAVPPSVKLVVLNACYNNMHAEALLAHVDCVVGMGSSIRDDAARAFAIGFYGGLGERQSVASAYLQGCAAISLEESPDDERPQLRVRESINPDGIVLAEIDAVDRGTQRASGIARSPSPDDTAHRSSTHTTTAAASIRPRRPTVLARPVPAYPDTEVKQLSSLLEHARARRDKLRVVGVAVDHLDREILEMRRQLREGGRLQAGDTLGDGRYLLVRAVGRGGFAVVWEAFDRAEQQRVAIKVLHTNLAGDPLRRERFFRGAQAMMRVKHPAVVRVLEPKGEDGGFYYFVMEFVAGGNLREAVLEGRVKHEDALPLVLRIGDVLALAHSQGMVHRDIKPANILLDEHGRAKLTDFDLVCAYDTTGGTRTGALGTVVYAAPECLEKPQEATARADVYSLGMTMMFCLSGRELSLATFKNPESTIATLQCSERVRGVLGRAVRWEPGARFENAQELTAELRRAAGQHPIEDTPGSAPREIGTQPGPTSRAAEPHDRPSARELGRSLPGRRIADALEFLLSSLPVYGTIVSVFGGTGITMAIFGLFLILQGVLSRDITVLAVAAGTACVALGISVAYAAARSVSDRAHALATAAQAGARLRAQAIVVSIVAGVGAVATALLETLAPVWR